MKNIDMFFRILAATFGMYFLSSAITTFVLVLLEINPEIQEIVEAFKIEFLIGIAVILWVFYTKNIVRTWFLIIFMTGIFFALSFYLIKGGVL
ncbi:hypothetical protein [Aliarcobacter butzleri]|uniref:hypothetical protein n=1 Tax=Aliarcobacter butzleri TaxID=28197 RepID=UPI001EDA0760|nr:hypothetical protein [Aliarcobacter butzleri]MCG3671550.1 hypothetical protein [Aliarcobacter butzleri]MCG3690530.1 hypothetical protein [Aliarcobacter butzleri]